MKQSKLIIISIFIIASCMHNIFIHASLPRTKAKNYPTTPNKNFKHQDVHVTPEARMLYKLHQIILDDEAYELSKILKNPQKFTAQYDIDNLSAQSLCNKQDPYGRMTLHYAALAIQHKRARIAQLLLHHGADNTIKDLYGDLPRHMRSWQTKWYQAAFTAHPISTLEQLESLIEIEYVANIQAQAPIDHCLERLKKIKGPQQKISVQPVASQVDIDNVPCSQPAISPNTIATTYIETIAEQAKINVSNPQSKLARSLQTKIAAAKLVDTFNKTAMHNLAQKQHKEN